MQAYTAVVATTYVTAGLGFLAGILWLDLMFDVQLLRARRIQRNSSDALASIAAYYRHATLGARPMNLLIALVMAATLAAIVLQMTDEPTPHWVSWTSLFTSGLPITLAICSTVPSATKLGALPEQAHEERGRLANRVLRDHVIALMGIVGTLILQLVFAP